jgi:hypothetical protein
MVLVVLQLPLLATTVYVMVLAGVAMTADPVV